MQHGSGSGPGNGNGNSKRWLLIALLVLGGFWLVNDSYGDGYRDALVQTGQAGNVRYYRGGPDFPWGLLILGGIGYIAWRKGAFDRFGGPGGPFGGNSQRGVQPYGPGNNPVFRGPRGLFEEWHRESHQAHEAQQAQRLRQDAQPQAPAAPAPPAPPAPSPEYWDTMSRASGATNGGSQGERV